MPGGQRDGNAADPGRERRAGSGTPRSGGRRSAAGRGGRRPRRADTGPGRRMCGATHRVAGQRDPIRRGPTAPQAMPGQAAVDLLQRQARGEQLAVRRRLHLPRRPQLAHPLVGPRELRARLRGEGVVRGKALRIVHGSALLLCAGAPPLRGALRERPSYPRTSPRGRAPGTAPRGRRAGSAASSCGRTRAAGPGRGRPGHGLPHTRVRQRCAWTPLSRIERVQMKQSRAWTPSSRLKGN